MKAIILFAIVGIAIAAPQEARNEISKAVQDRVEVPKASTVREGAETTKTNPNQERTGVSENNSAQDRVEVTSPVQEKVDFQAPNSQEQVKEEQVKIDTTTSRIEQNRLAVEETTPAPLPKVDLQEYMILVPMDQFRELISLNNDPTRMMVQPFAMPQPFPVQPVPIAQPVPVGQHIQNSVPFGTPTRSSFNTGSSFGSNSVGEEQTGATKGGEDRISQVREHQFTPEEIRQSMREQQPQGFSITRLNPFRNLIPSFLQIPALESKA